MTTPHSSTTPTQTVDSNTYHSSVENIDGNRVAYGDIYQPRRHAPHKNLDFTTSGKSVNNLFTYLVVADGHGPSRTALVTDYFRNLNWASFLEDPDFMEKIYSDVEALGNTRGMGSTLTIAIITKNQAEIYWVGDSQCRVYKNLEEVWASNDHGKNNASEMERINIANQSGEISWRPKTVPAISPDWATKVLSPTEITMELSPYFRFGPHDSINMTNSIGHNGLTGKYWDEHVIEFDDNTNWKIVIATDGFWGMTAYLDLPRIASPAEGPRELLDLSNSRWTQTWKFYNVNEPKDNQTPQELPFPYGQEDDTGIAVWYRGV